MAIRFEGHAIVSADGMIADSAGEMPPELRNDADWAQFQAALDRAAIVVLGSRGHARHPSPPGRTRLVVSSTVRGVISSSGREQWWWNPSDRSVEDALLIIGIEDGVVAVTGGTRVFDLFAAHLTNFVLSEVHSLVLPGGTPAFLAGHPRVVLASYGLVPGPAEVLGNGVTLTRWSR